MTVLTINSRVSWHQLLVADGLLLSVALLLPAASHLTALPLYQFNPMLLLMAAGMGFATSLPKAGRLANGLALALLMPLLSALLVGMPSPLKALCMGAELATAATLVALIPATLHGWQKAATLLLALLAGKGVFYALKALLMAPALLVSTPLWLQAATLLLAVGIYAWVSKRMAQ